MPVEQTVKGILVQQELGGVGAVEVLLRHGRNLVQQAQVVECLGILPAADPKALEYLLLGRFLAVGVLREQLHPNQGAKAGGLAAIVPPHGGADIADAPLPAGRKPFPSDPEGLSLVGGDAVPGPDASGEDDAVRELLVLFKQPGVHFLFRMVIVPVYQRQPLRNGCPDLLQGLLLDGGLVIVIPALVQRPEEHIAPYHRIQGKLPAQLYHHLQMVP